MSDPKHQAVAVIERQDVMHPLVSAAISRDGLDTTTLRELMELQERHEKNESVKAFNVAMVALKRDLPAVINRDAAVAYGKTRYTHATLAGAMDVVQPILTRHGFSMSWRTRNDLKEIEVTCVLAHELGHSIETRLSGTPDTSGQKNATQSIASTVTYLKRYTALSLLGIATADMKDPDPPRQPMATETIDDGTLISVVTGLKKIGLGKNDAEAYIDKPAIEWTHGDVDRLRQWARGRPAKVAAPVAGGFVNDDGTINEPPPMSDDDQGALL